jgi:hypothetical protein
MIRQGLAKQAFVQDYYNLGSEIIEITPSFIYQYNTTSAV